MKKFLELTCTQILTVGICCLFFFSLSLSCAYAQSDNYKLPDPQIKAGIAKVSGKILGQNQVVKSLTLNFHNPVTAEEGVIETSIKDDGSFCFEVPIEISVLSGYLGTIGYSGSFIPLYADHETKLNLHIDNSNRSIYLSVTGMNFLDKIDIDKYNNLLDKYLVCPGSKETLYEMSPHEFAQHEMKMIEKRTEYALNGIELSNTGRTYITNDFKLLHLTESIFQYKEAMKRSFQNNGKEKTATFSPQEPDRTYYTFLRSFNLNDPQYIYSFFYPKVMQCILSAEALNITPIADTPIDEWLSDVKATLADLVGFESGQFYDILAANAYAKQFNEKQIPLSDKQKENIRKYYGNDGEIAKILLRRNDKIIEIAAEKMAPVIKETPEVPKEKIMDTIVSKYKGKVVVVDLWATWCGPCMQAIKQIWDVKHELKGKDVVYVYITNGSSPKKLWGEVIATINGEHYYITGEKWKYIMESFGFEYIPSYLIYDTKGELKHKFTGYPSNAEMKKIIEELLP